MGSLIGNISPLAGRISTDTVLCLLSMSLPILRGLEPWHCLHAAPSVTTAPAGRRVRREALMIDLFPLPIHVDKGNATVGRASGRHPADAGSTPPGTAWDFPPMMMVIVRRPHEDLLTIVKRHKLQWYGHVSHSSGLAKTVLQGTVRGGRRQGKQRKRCEDNIREWTGLEFAKSQRAVQNRENGGNWL